MFVVPSQLFLDTNVYVIGAGEPNSPEAAILQWISDRTNSPGIQVSISPILLSEISRVATRLRRKDWAGKIINDIWTTLNPQPSTGDGCSRRISPVARERRPAT